MSRKCTSFFFCCSIRQSRRLEGGKQKEKGGGRFYGFLVLLAPRKVEGLFVGGLQTGGRVKTNRTLGTYYNAIFGDTGLLGKIGLLLLGKKCAKREKERRSKLFLAKYANLKCI